MSVNTQEAIEALETIRDWVRWAVSQYCASDVTLAQGNDDPWDEASWLVLHALHLPWDIDQRILDARITASERAAVAEIIRRRIDEHVPAAYLMQTAWFAGLEFKVDERVLIPRSPIAELIENGFEPWKPRDQVSRILELCTGSGCIAVACAMHLPYAEVTATELSEEALQVAQENADLYGLSSLNLLQGDLFANAEGPFDVIVTNPPYVDADTMGNLPKEFKHEPDMALASGEDGLFHVHQILAKAHEYLSDDGILICEVGDSQYALVDAYPQLPFTWLEFERGGHGVFLLHAADLRQAAAQA